MSNIIVIVAVHALCQLGPARIHLISDVVKVICVESGMLDKTTDKCIQWLSAYFDNASLILTTPLPALCALSSNGGNNHAALFALIIPKITKNIHRSQVAVLYSKF